MKKLLVTIMMLLPLLANAYDFEKDGIYYNITSLQELTVEVTSGDNYYEGNIILPESVEYGDKLFIVTAVGENAFASCDNLLSIELPHSILSLKSNAFIGCWELHNITIPSSVKDIQTGVFYCSGLNYIVIEDSDEPLFIGRSHNYTSGGSPFVNCKLKYIYIGRNISNDYYGYDDDSMFSNQSFLEDVVFGDKVTSIHWATFLKCSGLRYVKLPNKMRELQYRSFEGCTNLSDILLNEGLEMIGRTSFKGCTSIKKIILPSTLKGIGDEAFLGCTAITEVYSKITEPFDIAESTFAGITYLNSVLYVPVGTKSLYQERTGWKDFATIVETDDFDTILSYFSANITVLDGGTIVCNGVSIANTNMTTNIKSGDDVRLQIIPANSYRLASLIVNGNDVTDYVTDGVYTIKNVSSNVDIYASFERHFDVGNLTKVIDFIMNSTASAEDIALYDLNNNKKLDIGDIILIVKFILNNSNNAPNFVSRRAGVVADLSQYTAAQFEVKTTGNVNIENIRLVKSMEQTHLLMCQQKDANTYAVVVYSMSNQLMSPENGKIIEIGNSSDILSIENVTVATPTGETAYFNTLSATTGIEQTERGNGTAVIYDLKGNRLNNSKALEKGIYIVNGKKTVVR